MGIPFMIFEITKATHFIIHPYTIIQKNHMEPYDLQLVFSLNVFTD